MLTTGGAADNLVAKLYEVAGVDLFQDYLGIQALIKQHYGVCIGDRCVPFLCEPPLLFRFITVLMLNKKKIAYNLIFFLV